MSFLKFARSHFYKKQGFIKKHQISIAISSGMGGALIGGAVGGLSGSVIGATIGGMVGYLASKYS